MHLSRRSAAKTEDRQRGWMAGAWSFAHSSVATSTMGEHASPLLGEDRIAMERRWAWRGGNRDVIISITIAARLNAGSLVKSRKCAQTQNADLVRKSAGCSVNREEAGPCLWRSRGE